MSTQDIQERVARRNAETRVFITTCLILLGLLGGLNLFSDGSFFDGLLVGAIAICVIFVPLWYIGTSLLGGITLHWDAKERQYRSQTARDKQENTP